MDIGGFLKFKPWGATKLANGLGSALAVVGIALEAWDSYKEKERQEKFRSTIEQMIVDLQQQSKEVVALIEGSEFHEKFFPALGTLKDQLNAINSEMARVEDQHVKFRHWYDSGKVIDVEFREIRPASTVEWKDISSIARPEVVLVPESVEVAVPAFSVKKSTPKPFWKKLFS